jgi:hypothetical protein
VRAPSNAIPSASAAPAPAPAHAPSAAAVPPAHAPAPPAPCAPPSSATLSDLQTQLLMDLGLEAADARQGRRGTAGIHDAFKCFLQAEEACNRP